MNEKQILLAKKLKALADRGIGGEKLNAQNMLDAHLKKHGIAYEDIEAEALHDFYYNVDGIFSKLLHQIACRVRYGIRVFGIPKKDVKKHKLPGNFIIECTTAEYIEIDLMYDIYKKLYESELDVFYTAFLAANDLLARPPVTKSYEDLSPEDQEKQDRAAKMAQAVKTATIRKQLTK